MFTEFTPKEGEQQESPDRLCIGFDWAKMGKKYLDLLKREDSPLLKLPNEIKFPEQGIVLLTGPNGSGKSTLINAIFYGLLPEAGKVVGDLRALRTTLAKEIAKTLTFLDGDFFVPIAIQPEDYIRSRQTTDLSHRQGIDALLEKELAQYDQELDIEEEGTNGLVLMIDEPEMGMDPARHKKIERELGELQRSAQLLIIATNSPILVDSKLPRIDLNQPHLGLYYPNEKLSGALMGGFTEGVYDDF